MQLFKSAVTCSPSRDESQRRVPRPSLTSMPVGLLQFRTVSCGGDTFLVSMGCRGLLWGGEGAPGDILPIPLSGGCAL